MTDILKPADGRLSYKHGVGHDGKPRATVPETPGMHTPARGADAFTGATVHPGNIARDGAAKKHQNVGVHGGMTPRQNSGMAMGHSTSVAPLDDERLDINPVVGKSYPLPRAANKGADCSAPDYDLGARIIAEAPKPR